MRPAEKRWRADISKRLPASCVWLAVELLDEIHEPAVVEAVGRARGHVPGRSTASSGDSNPWNLVAPEFDQRRQAADDRRRHEVREVHPERRRLDVDAPVRARIFTPPS